MTHTLLSKIFQVSGNLVAASMLLAAYNPPAYAAVGLPVGVTLASADAVRPGEPVTVIAVLEPAADFANATFLVDQPEQWQLLDGMTRWAGALEKGKLVQLRFRAVPLTATPTMMMATVQVDGQTKRAGLDPARMGRQFPELATADADGEKGGQREAVESYLPQHDPNVVLPEPAAPNFPRVPVEERAAAQLPVRSGKTTGARKASVVASGRWTFIDNNGVRRGVRNATVQMVNEDPIAAFNSGCGNGVTDGDGNFTISGDCGDLAFGSDANPDLFVRLVLNNNVVEVKPDSLFAGTYTVRSSTKQNSPGGAVSFGTLTVPSSVTGAAAAHNLVMRAQQFMAAAGESMSKVTVLWPSTSDSPVAFYTPILATLNIKQNEPMTRQFTIFHEYGHHILGTKAESPAPDYDNGECDQPGHPGHCLDRPEKGTIAWTEGFPDFLGALLRDRFAAADGYAASPFNIEGFNAPDEFTSQSDLLHIEGITAAILLDLVDTNNESGENLTMSFSDIWDVVKNYDPSSNLLHNHPTSITEFYDGLRVDHLSRINRIAEVYAHNGITRPRPDLRITSLQNPPTQINRGAQFSNDSEVSNTGNERANSAFTVRYLLALESNRLVTLQLSTRNIAANMAAGSSTDIAQTFTVPATMTPGMYRLIACADSTGAVPESSDTNNCRTATTRVQVQ
ncbi:MAG: hypothetical protein HY820_21480 [Acidobacteria bacterium]|nr:hypothetical protein [Acidobacteriota bacterium]